MNSIGLFPALVFGFFNGLCFSLDVGRHNSYGVQSLACTFINYYYCYPVQFKFQVLLQPRPTDKRTINYLIAAQLLQSVPSVSQSVSQPASQLVSSAATDASRLSFCVV